MLGSGFSLVMTDMVGERKVRKIGRRASLVVVDRGLDGVLGQDRAVDLDRRQREFLGDLAVLDLRRLVDRLALDPFGHQRARSDRRTAAEGLERASSMMPVAD